MSSSSAFFVTHTSHFSCGLPFPYDLSDWRVQNKNSRVRSHVGIDPIAADQL